MHATDPNRGGLSHLRYDSVCDPFAAILIALEQTYRALETAKRAFSLAGRQDPPGQCARQSKVRSLASY
jgi:hypothetical protein